MSVPKLESWTLDTSHRWTAAVVSDDHVVARTDDGMLAGWRVTERGGISSLWRRPSVTGGGPICLDADGKHVLVASPIDDATELMAFDIAHGTLVWKTRVDGEAQTLFDAHDETWVFLGDQAAVLTQGELKTRQGIDVHGTWAIRRGGTIDVWARDRYVCLAPTPSIQWIARKTLGVEVESIAFGEEYTAARQAGGKTLRLFRRFDPIWGQTVYGPGRLGQPCIDEARDRVYVALTTGEVVAWQLSSGELLWQSAGARAEELHSPPAPVLIDRYLVVAMRSGHIIIIDRETGALLGESSESPHLGVVPMPPTRLLTTGTSLRVYRLGS